MINVFIAYAEVFSLALLLLVGKDALTLPFEDFHFFNSAYRWTATREQPEPPGLTTGQLVPVMVLDNS